jgi:hypothetical protein
MKKPSPAASCLLIGMVVALLLWLLGDKPTALVIFAAEAIGWSVLYAATSSREE